jgi:hypothetical protein
MEPLETATDARAADFLAMKEAMSAATAARRARDVAELVQILEAIQAYADRRGLLFDIDAREALDWMLSDLVRHLDLWGDLEDSLPARAVLWYEARESKDS